MRTLKKMKHQPVYSKAQSKIIGYIKHCRKLSSAEVLIAKFLSANGIEYYTDFFFKDMLQNKKLKLLFYDFFIPDYKLCIEYDGEQHYTGIYGTKKLVNQRSNDFLKTAFCKKKGIELLRIKFTDKENIEDKIIEKFDKIDPICSKK